MIPTQHIFMVEKDGTLKIKQVSDIPKEIKFKSQEEAREFVKDYKYQL